ncbi:MAG TPA: hypothetical protein VF137_00360 [Candidatus Dormibacteraeota bacterium]
MTLYDIIAELRREHPAPEASRTLDMMVTELGRTRDNLRHALMNLEERPIPPAGKQVLGELEQRARRADLFDLQYGPPPPLPGEVVAENLDEATAGIGALLVLSSLLIVGLAAVATAIGVVAAVRAGG